MKRIIAIFLSVGMLMTTCFSGESYALESRVYMEMFQASSVLQNFLHQSLEYNFREEDLVRVLIESSSPEDLEDMISEQGILFQVLDRFDTGFEGILAEMTYGDVKKLASIEAVSGITYDAVLEAPAMKVRDDFYLMDESSNAMIQADRLQSGEPLSAGNYVGRNRLVAILDTGLFYEHEMFSTPLVEKKIKDSAQLEELKREKEIRHGRWLSDKVPFAYHYAGNDHEIVERDSKSHGTHVTGIIAANGVHLKGVAPEAQIAFMRVFNENNTGRVSTYVRALQDAVKLDVDAINMSLGTPGGSSKNVYLPMKKVLKAAKDKGIAVAIAAGNSGFAGWDQSEKLPFAKHPDIGVLGDPAISEDSIAVASIDNAAMFDRFMELTYGGENKKILFKETDVKGLSKDFVRFMDAGYGTEAELDALTGISGKYLLIKRGDPPSEAGILLTYAQKIQNAERKNAAGVIIYNNLEKAPISEMEVGGTSIPSASISYEDGAFLKQILEDHPDARLRFPDRREYIENPLGGKPSAFSSWGITTDGVLKPDLAAPGGQIYSGILNHKYSLMDGTSMAAPHVAGAVLVLKEYVERNFGSSGQEAHRQIKNLLMSTAKPYREEGGTYASPRKQGAGLIQVFDAINAEVAVEGENGTSSLYLGDLQNGTLKIEGSLKNYGNRVHRFQYHAVLIADEVSGGNFTLRSKQLLESPEKNIFVDAQGEANFSVDLQVEESVLEELKRDMENGFFLEGFVFFKELDDGSSASVSHPEISAPFVGFHGRWAQVPVIEKSIYDFDTAAGERPYYFEKSISLPAFTHLGSEQSRGRKVVLGNMPDSTASSPHFQKDRLAFSPNGDGEADYVQFFGTFLRDYENLQIKIYEKSGAGKGRRIFCSSELGESGNKNIYLPHGERFTTTNLLWRWDGRDDKSRKVAEGSYFLEVSVRSSAPNSEAQSMDFPITLDRTPAHIARVEYDRGQNSLIVQKIVEQGSGIREAYLTYRSAGEAQATVLPFEEGIALPLPANFNPVEAELIIVDHAYNKLRLPFEELVKNSGTDRYRLELRVATDFFHMNGEPSWELRDAVSLQQLDPASELKPGSYLLKILDYDKHFAPENGSDEIFFDIVEGEYLKTVTLNFTYRDRMRIFLNFEKALPSGIKLYLKRLSDNEKTECKPAFVEGRPNLYVAYVEAGEYEMIVEGAGASELLVKSSGEGSRLILKKSDANKEVQVSLVKKKAPEAGGNTGGSDSGGSGSGGSGSDDSGAASSGGGGGGSAGSDAPAPTKPPMKKKVPEPSVAEDGKKESRTYAAEAALRFKDVNEDDWFAPFVGFVSKKNLMSGTSVSEFEPNVKNSRAMLVAVLHRLEGKPQLVGSKGFSDIGEDQWYADAAAWAKKSGIVNGYPDGSFKPDQKIVRADIALMLMNYAKWKGDYRTPENSSIERFADAEKVPTYALEAMAWANAEGILQGKPGNLLEPGSEASRAELSAMISRFYERFVKEPALN